MRTLLKNSLRLLWRVWFYLLFAATVLLFSPVLIVVTSRERWYPQFFKVAKLWGRVLLFGMGFSIKMRTKPALKKEGSYVFIANHTSIIDIMLMLVIVPNPFVFVGKKELARIPVFGFFYRKTCILVDRSDIKSRANVFSEVQKRLNAGLSVCIFPEGLVPDDESIVLDDFKRGAFSLAISHQLPIVPIVFYDCKLRFSYTFFSGSPGVLRVKFLPVVETASLEPDDWKNLRNRCHEQLHSALISS